MFSLITSTLALIGASSDLSFEKRFEAEQLLLTEEVGKLDFNNKQFTFTPKDSSIKSQKLEVKAFDKENKIDETVIDNDNKFISKNKLSYEGDKKKDFDNLESDASKKQEALNKATKDLNESKLQSEINKVNGEINNDLVYNKDFKAYNDAKKILDGLQNTDANFGAQTDKVNRLEEKILNETPNSDINELTQKCLKFNGLIQEVADKTAELKTLKDNRDKATAELKEAQTKVDEFKKANPIENVEYTFTIKSLITVGDDKKVYKASGKLVEDNKGTLTFTLDSQANTEESFFVKNKVIIIGASALLVAAGITAVFFRSNKN